MLFLFLDVFVHLFFFRFKVAYELFGDGPNSNKLIATQIGNGTYFINFLPADNNIFNEQELILVMLAILNKNGREKRLKSKTVKGTL